MIDSFKGVVFDAYGTVLDVASINAETNAVLGDKTATIAADWRSKQLSYTWLRSLMGTYQPFSAITKDALDYATQAEGVSLSESEVNQLMASYGRIKAFDDAAHALKVLRKTHQLAILTNADLPMVEEALAFNQINGFLDEVLSADTLRIFKPSPKVYQLACDRLNLSCEEILFVSSNTWDVSGAKQFGLATCWLNRQSGTMDCLGVQPDFEVSSLSALFSSTS